MKTIGSLILTLLLVGCGGGSDNSDKEIEQPVSKIDDTKILSSDKNGKVTTIKLAGNAEGVAVSKDALFAAVGKDGVEIHKIGYDSLLSSEYVTAIDGINAKSVSLSEDGTRLYVVNEEGFVNVISITNLSTPVKEMITTQSKIKKEIVSKDGNYKYLPKGKKGLEIYDISNPSNEKLVIKFNKSNAYDVVLADKDTKALLAAGISGINLIDITDPNTPNITAHLTIDGNIRGISLNEEQGLLFVANGDKGVIVYSLNILLDKITKAK